MVLAERVVVVGSLTATGAWVVPVGLLVNDSASRGGLGGGDQWDYFWIPDSRGVRTREIWSEVGVATIMCTETSTSAVIADLSRGCMETTSIKASSPSAN